MSAYLTYEIHGTNSRGKAVFITIKALSTPEQDTAEWLIKQRYPTATEVTVVIPAAHRYPDRTPAVIKVGTTPVRRAG